MHELSINQLKPFIRFVTQELREPLLIKGTFGVGKSEAIHQVASENPDDVLIDIRLSQWDSVDLRGLPGLAEEDFGDSPVIARKAAKLVRKAKLTNWYMPAALPFKGNPHFAGVKGTIWLFLDEINAAQLATLAVAYMLVNDRRVGEFELMDNVVIVAAGNLATDKGVVNRMPMPLLNRFVQVKAVVSVPDFCEHHQKVGDLPPIAFAFYNFKKELLHTYDPKAADEVCSTPRTAAKAWRAWQRHDKPAWMREAVMAGCVGQGVALEILGFAKIWESLKDYIPKIKADPKGCDLPDMKSEEGLSVRYAVAMKLSGDMDQTTVKWIHPFLKRLNPDIAIMAWSFALRRDDNLYTAPEFLDYSRTYSTVFER